MAQGETTPEERIQRQLRRINEVLLHYDKRFCFSRDTAAPQATEDFVFQLLHDAVYLALHEGLDWQTIFERASQNVLGTFPNVMD
jgi:hypothetical protein